MNEVREADDEISRRENPLAQERRYQNEQLIPTRWGFTFNIAEINTRGGFIAFHVTSATLGTSVNLPFISLRRNISHLNVQSKVPTLLFANLSTR